jgi:hypothetical protein
MATQDTRTMGPGIWVEDERERHRLTLKSLDDVRMNAGVSHEAVVAWADSLGGDKPLPAPTWQSR